MEILKFIYENFWTTFCLIISISIAISAIILAVRGKNLWG